MENMQLHVVMTAKVEVDCYAGPECDQHRKYFNIFCDGDMQDDNSSEKKLTIKLAELPPGAIVTVSYPCCPDCGTPREDKFSPSMRIVGHAKKCHCGFDWVKWTDEQFS